MSFNLSKAQKLTLNDAEALAAQALGFLASDPQRLVAFLSASGTDVAEIRARAGEAEFLSAVLDHLVRDESLLLVFAAEAGLKPEAVVRAFHILAGDITP